MIRPFLKWAGAKTKIASRISEVAPVNAVRFIEPFAGSASVALNLGFEDSLIADTNPDLIRVYTSLAMHNGRFINDCEEFFNRGNNSEAAFYRLRDEFNSTRAVYRKACLFVYLNRHCFNGLCRYNASGKFNVPFGRYEGPYFPRAEMEQFYSLLHDAEFVHSDFREVLAQAEAGDFVYCDPPYVPVSGTANFTAYAKGGFSVRDQQELMDACVAAAERGAVVVVSNHDTDYTRQLYAAASEIRAFEVSRLISCDGENRNKAKELLAIFNYANEPLRGPLGPLVEAV